MGKFTTNMEDYVGYEAFNEFMTIMYEQLKGKVGTETIKEIQDQIAALGELANLLKVEDIVKSFEDFDPTAEGADRKVAAAALVKSIKDQVDALAADGDADTLGGLGKDDFVKKDDVIFSWDNFNAETTQVVAAVIVKNIKETLDEVQDSVRVINESKGQPNGIAGLDENGKIPSELIPGSYDDVVDVYAVNETNEAGELVSTKLYLDAEHTQEVAYAKSIIYLDVTNPDVAGDSYRWSGTALVNLGHPKFKEITADEVQAMWDSIIVPDPTVPDSGEETV